MTKQMVKDEQQEQRGVFELVKKEVIVPSIPEKWDYNESIEKVKTKLTKWTKLTNEIFEELWTARETLSMSYSERAKKKLGTNVPSKDHLRNTGDVSPWEKYCREVGYSRQTINRWLRLVVQERKMEVASTRRSNPEHFKSIADEYVSSVDSVIGKESHKFNSDRFSFGTNTFTKGSSNIFFNSFHQEITKKYIPEFIHEIKEKMDEGFIKEAVLMLSNGFTSEEWFKPLYDGVLCITDHKVILQGSNGDGPSKGRNGVCFVYFGQNQEKFIDEFSKHGTVLVKIREKQEVAKKQPKKVKKFVPRPPAKKAKLVTMKMKNGDCGVCAFAMVAGVTYDESFSFLHSNVFLDNRKIPLVRKKEMQKALDLFPITYDYFRSEEKWENLKGTFCLLYPKAPGFIRHWIVYEPSTDKIYDPTGKTLEKNKYKDLQSYFSIG